MLPVFVFLPWCEVWGAAPGGGRLTVSLDQRDLRWSWAHSCRSVTVLHPGWVKGWWSGPGSCRAAKQGLIHIGRPGLDPVAAGASVLKVECLHSTVGQFHQDPHCSQWSRVTEGGLCLPDSASRVLCANSESDKQRRQPGVSNPRAKGKGAGLSQRGTTIQGAS